MFPCQLYQIEAPGEGAGGKTAEMREVLGVIRGGKNESHEYKEPMFSPEQDIADCN